MLPFISSNILGDILKFSPLRTKRPSNYENFKLSKRRMTKLHRFLTKSLFEKTLDERYRSDGWNRMECRGGDEASFELRKFQSLKATNDKIASSNTFPDKIGKTLDERHGNDGWNRIECRGGDEESDRSRVLRITKISKSQSDE